MTNIFSGDVQLSDSRSAHGWSRGRPDPVPRLAGEELTSYEDASTLSRDSCPYTLEVNTYRLLASVPLSSRSIVGT